MAQLGDGLVALPRDARTQEHLEWVADAVQEADGSATLWRAQTLSAADERTVAGAMAAARAEEYDAITRQAKEGLHADGMVRERLLRRLRRELRAVQRRDYFPPVQRDVAVAALVDLAEGGRDRSAAAAPRSGS